MSTAIATPAPASNKRTITAIMALPLFFIIALPLLFIGLMHSPQPNELKVAVIGDSASTSALVHTLATQTGDSFDVSRIDTVAEAERQVKRLEVRGAYDPATGNVYVAEADGVQAERAVTTLFTSVASQSKATITVKNLVPLAKSDPIGTSALYIGLGAMIGGMLTGVILGLLPASTKTRLVAVVAVPAIVAVAEVLYGWALFDIFPGNAFVPGLILFGISLVTALITLGGMLLIGPAMLVVSILGLVLFGITGSGVAMPLDLAPGFYSGLHSFVPTARGLSALRRVIYADGYNPGWDVLVLLLGLVGGALLTAAGLVKSRRTAAPSGLEREIDDVEEQLVSGGIEKVTA